MRVITTSGNRDIKLVLRFEQSTTSSYKVNLTNKNTGVSSEITITDYTMTEFNNNDGQLVVSFDDYTYNEGAEFNIKVTDLLGVVVYHRNKLFVTDQTPQDYNING